MTRLTKEQRAKRAQTALQALWLSVTSRTTKADRQRLVWVEDGLHALDDEQAMLRAGMEKLIGDYGKREDPDALLDGLRRLVDRKD